MSIPLHALLLSIGIHALWGGNPIAVKFGLEAFPPFWSAFLRFVIGIITVVLWCRFRGIRLWPTLQEWRPILQIGLLFTLQIGIMNLGFESTSGTNASILISTNPLFAALFAHLLIDGDRLNLARITGLLIAFAGVTLTLLNSAATHQALSFGNIGDWLCLLSACLLGYRLISSAQVMKNLDPMRLTLWQMVISLPLYALAGALFETINWHALGPAPVLGLLYQGVIVAGAGFMISLWLISRYRPSVMVSFNFIAPLTGVLASAWLLGERLSAMVLIGAMLLAIGMIMITRAR